VVSWQEQWDRKAKRTVQVNTEETKACAKCGRSNIPVYRHHAGNDGFLGRFNKAIRFGYNRWLDCVPLCFDHHMEIHYLYDQRLRNWLNHTPLGARAMRATLIGVCQDWLAGKIKSPQIPKAYRRQFERSLAEWKEAQSEK
jgi:hypothetical protein